MAKYNFVKGDRIAFAAKFLKSICADYDKAQLRGTFESFDPSMKNYGYVHWDNEGERIASRQGNYAEQDYCDHVKKHGSFVCLDNIAKVGSIRFAD